MEVIFHDSCWLSVDQVKEVPEWDEDKHAFKTDFKCNQHKAFHIRQSIFQCNCPCNCERLFNIIGCHLFLWTFLVRVVMNLTTNQILSLKFVTVVEGLGTGGVGRGAGVRGTGEGGKRWQGTIGISGGTLFRVKYIFHLNINTLYETKGFILENLQPM